MASFVLSLQLLLALLVINFRTLLASKVHVLARVAHTAILSFQPVNNKIFHLRLKISRGTLRRGETGVPIDDGLPNETVCVNSKTAQIEGVTIDVRNAPSTNQTLLVQKSGGDFETFVELLTDGFPADISLCHRTHYSSTEGCLISSELDSLCPGIPRGPNNYCAIQEPYPDLRGYRIGQIAFQITNLKDGLEDEAGYGAGHLRFEGFWIFEGTSVANSSVSSECSTSSAKNKAVQYIVTALVLLTIVVA